MDLLSPEVLEFRWGGMLCLAVVFLVLERMVPLRAATIDSKLHHVSTNLVILGSNTLLGQLLAGWGLFLWSSRVGSETWGLLPQLSVGPIAHVVLSVMLLDLVSYGIHRLNHHVPILWRFHRAHHSDPDVDVTTSGRFHPAETVVNAGLKGACILGLGISPIGVLISETLLLAGGQFQHANIRLPVWLEKGIRMVLVTPPMHWVHHSRRLADHNRNFGVMFSWWDRCFGTYAMVAQPQQLALGLDEYPSLDDVHLLRVFRMPFDPACRPSDDSLTGRR